MKNEKMPHGGSYEASLTEEERVALRALLFSDESLQDVQGKTVPWRDGPDKGLPPSLATLCKIKSRLRAEQMVFGMDEMLATISATKTQLSTLDMESNAEQMLDAAMTAIGHEVLAKTLEGADPASQRVVTRLLLKRADQRRFDRRMDYMEAELKKSRKNQGVPMGTRLGKGAKE